MFIKGFDKQLLGVKKNQVKGIEATLPENYPKKEFARKKAIFKCKILNIKKSEPVKIDDQFAKNLGAKDLNNLQEFIEIHNFALGEKNETKTIGTKGALTYITNNQNLDLQKIEIQRLDNFAEYAQIIKIDVEGFEEFVLKGAEQVLNHPDTHAVIIELAGYNRYNSSNAIIPPLHTRGKSFSSATFVGL